MRYLLLARSHRARFAAACSLGPGTAYALIAPCRFQPSRKYQHRGGDTTIG